MNRFLKFLLSLSTVAMTTILPIAANDGHEAVAAVLPAWSVFLLSVCSCLSLSSR